MKDFTLRAYRRYLQAIQSSFSHIMRFDDYLLSDPKPHRFCLIRHDVDRKPKNALEMARLEYEAGVNASYYFRAKPNVFDGRIIKEIESLGHEIGYHYESLTDAKGDMLLALKDFKENLRRFRETATVRTISMHGAPLSRFDNRDLWRDLDRHAYLLKELDILGEIYLDIDYADIAYINDTGRNWSSTKSNIRDQVNSTVTPNFKNGDELYHYLNKTSDSRIVFQVHPERWTEKKTSYWISLLSDTMANAAKYMVKMTGEFR